jgi:hypothetical protein
MGCGVRRRIGIQRFTGVQRDPGHQECFVYILHEVSLVHNSGNLAGRKLRLTLAVPYHGDNVVPAARGTVAGADSAKSKSVEDLANVHNRSVRCIVYRQRLDLEFNLHLNGFD